MADASLVQTLDPVTLEADGSTGLVANFHRQLGKAVLTSDVTLGERDYSLVNPGLYNLTGQVRDSGGAILCFVGPPNRSLDWRLLEGVGTLTPFTTYTDATGRASCRFDAAGITGHVVIGVAYVP